MAGKDFPDSYEGWEERARSAMTEEKFRYVAAGAGTEDTIRANAEAFRRWKLVPRVLRDVGQRDTSTTLLGQKIHAPLLLAPVKGLGYIHRDGDLGVARVAAGLGIPLVVSTFATTTVEVIAQTMGGAPRWFQLYPGKDKDISESLLKRVEESGYSAVVVTVDKAEDYPKYSGPRQHEHDKRGHELYFSDPTFRRKFGGDPESRWDEAWRFWKGIRLIPGLTPEGLREITERVKLPVIVKGILDPDDAKIAAENGASGVVVSNHGGRSLDGEIASLDALEPVRRAVPREVAVLLDSGVRSGADIVKALALGANAVLIGKAYLYGLGVAGEEGVRRVLTRLIGEFDLAMGICGAVAVGEINRNMVRGSS